MYMGEISGACTVSYVAESGGPPGFGSRSPSAKSQKNIGNRSPWTFTMKII